ncbi:hypothetical protein [Gimesia fumaroli]|uniref:Neutral/alkaline non-lysosomal ceramidase n=1 Tax=Gimesia fumaroli TaxID=2527976 RepID=A0A518IJ69_9PLAN|nr:hypothetical protein [Gimesia fumaroli]QDV53121.1 Neutral/alkaline non-lysosomal ceramidase [Gimesia fumaroli]
MQATGNRQLALIWICAICFSLIISSVSEAADTPGNKVFKAGAATSNITPPLGEAIVGGFKPFPSENVHDELHARCLVLDNGETKIAFVICDSLGITEDVYQDARKLIKEETDLPPENILMAATHTHSATRASSPTYHEFLSRRIADCVRRALENRVPAKIGWGGIDEPSEVFNRRWFTTNPEFCKNPFGGVDTVRMNPPRGNKTLVKPAGPIDPEISFISVQSLEGHPLALLANYSLHYVGGVKKGEISADYFGIFSEKIGSLIGAESDHPPFVGMLSNGTSGDINNINFSNPGKRKKPYEKMTQVANLVAQRVAEAYKNVKYHTWVPLGAASSKLTLKIRKPDATMQAYFKKVMTQPEDAPKHHRYERNYAGRVQRLLEGPDEMTVMLQVLRIGDLSIAAIPFETFCEIGLELKDKTPFEDAFTIEIANGYNGYLPTPAQHKLGGYETWMGTNRVQIDASDKITAIILDLMGKLHSGQ